MKELWMNCVCWIELNCVCWNYPLLLSCAQWDVNYITLCVIWYDKEWKECKCKCFKSEVTPIGNMCLKSKQIIWFGERSGYHGHIFNKF